MCVFLRRESVNFMSNLHFHKHSQICINIYVKVCTKSNSSTHLFFQNSVLLIKNKHRVVAWNEIM